MSASRGTLRPDLLGSGVSEASSVFAAKATASKASGDTFAGVFRDKEPVEESLFSVNITDV